MRRILTTALGVSLAVAAGAPAVAQGYRDVPDGVYRCDVYDNIHAGMPYPKEHSTREFVVDSGWNTVGGGSRRRISGNLQEEIYNYNGAFEYSTHDFGQGGGSAGQCIQVSVTKN